MEKIRKGWVWLGAVMAAGWAGLASAADTVVTPISTGIDYAGTVEGLGTTLALILGAFLGVVLAIVLFKVFVHGTTRALGGKA